jgi:hypothetical protein
VWSGGSQSSEWHPEPLPEHIVRLELLKEPTSVQKLIKGE